MSYKFILEPYNGQSSRHTCPKCHKKNQFSRYINTSTNNYVAAEVGKCNREAKCGYHLPPLKFYEQNPKSHFQNNLTNYSSKKIKPKAQTAKISSIPEKYVDLSLFRANETSFYKYFSQELSKEALDEAYKLYKVGRYHHKNWTNSVLFWQIDLKGNVRTGKIFKYDPLTGKRIAQNWFHSIHYKNKFKLKQVPFGLHLINENPTKKIVIVESEKTALLMSIAFPKFIWLAVGGCQNLNHSMISEIQNRDVVLIPDAGKYELWKSKVDNLPSSNFYDVRDLFHKYASNFEKEQDYDIADYYLQEIKSARSHGLI